MRTAMIVMAAGIVGLLATAATADSVDGFFMGNDAPGNSWTANVGYGISEVAYNYGNTLVSDPNHNSASGQHIDYYRPTDFNFNIVPLPSGTGYSAGSQYFEGLKPGDPSAKVTAYGAPNGTYIPDTETLFTPGPDQMEVHTATPFKSLGTDEEFVSLPLALGTFGGSLNNVPSFVLQAQAYNAYGDLLFQGEIEFIDLGVYRGTGYGEWDGSTDQNTNPSFKAYNAYASVQPFDATAPLPEPVTMLGVLASIGTAGAYFRRRQQVA